MGREEEIERVRLRMMGLIVESILETSLIPEGSCSMVASPVSTRHRKSFISGPGISYCRFNGQEAAISEESQ